MPIIYVIRHGETERLIEASTASVAVRHAAKAIIVVRPAKPKDVADLMARGVQVEKAGTDPDPIPPVPLPPRDAEAAEVLDGIAKADAPESSKALDRLMEGSAEPAGA